MTFPHPKSRKDNHGNEDGPNSPSVVWSVRRRIINVTEYWNAENNVNPAKNCTYDGLVHDLAPFTTLEPPEAA